MTARYLVSSVEMQQLDAQALTDLGLSGRLLMETAGRAVARLCMERLPPPGVIAVVCGTGNNGGDGFVAARALGAAGYEVSVSICGTKERLRDDAKAAFASLEKADEARVYWIEDARAVWQLADRLRRSQLAVDALLGTGIHGDVHGLVGDCIDVLNQAPTPVVAVDVPSGIDADTGAVLGRSVDADATVTFQLAKRGHYLFPGAERRGELVVADIGIAERLVKKLGVVGRLVLPADGPDLIRARRGDVHKGTFGHLVVVAGSPEFPGAAALTTTAALRAGAGLVSLAADETTLQRMPQRAPEVTLRVRGKGDLDGWANEVLKNATALAIGPGLTTDPARGAELAVLLANTTVPVVLDADALNILAQDPKLWSRLKAPAVLTPHPKEMARLLKIDVAQVQRDRFAAALQLAMARGCVVVLKGAGTVVAEPDGTVAVLGAGNPGLATGGTGDVLTGFIGSFLAQGYEPSAAARAGALLHAVAGDLAAARLSQTALIASDLFAAAAEVLEGWGR